MKLPTSNNRDMTASNASVGNVSFLIKPFPEFIEGNKRFFAGTLQRGDMSFASYFDSMSVRSSPGMSSKRKS